MKEIKAFIQPFMLGKVTKALEEIPEFPGLSVSDVRGFGRGKIEKKVRIVEYVPKVKIEIVAKLAINSPPLFNGNPYSLF